MTSRYRPSDRLQGAIPTNIAAADKYWSALGKWNGRDVRSEGVAIEVYRMAALHSGEGGMAFARAYQELFSVSGEAPRRKLFDLDLIAALRRCDDGSFEHKSIRWVLESVDQKLD